MTESLYCENSSVVLFYEFEVKNSEGRRASVPVVAEDSFITYKHDLVLAAIPAKEKG